MAKPGPQTRSDFEARLAEIWRRWNRGQSQWEISVALGICDRTVRNYLKTLENRWRKETSAGIAAHKEAELAKIQELFSTYWKSWEKSLDEKQTTSTEQSDTDTGARRKAAIKKESRDGNPAFLAGVQWCISEVCKIRGIYAPVSLDLSKMGTEEIIKLAQIIFGTGGAGQSNPDPLADRGRAGALEAGDHPAGGSSPAGSLQAMDPSGPSFDTE